MGRYLVRRPGIRWGAGLALLALVVTHLVAQRTAVSDKDVLPVLKQRCLQCHGEAVQMSNLDLRTRELALKGGDKGPALVPGNAAASRLYRRVAGLEQPAMPMAPLPALTSQEVSLLKDWIDQGAKWGPDVAAQPKVPAQQEKAITDEDRKWWAFQKPVRRPAPRVADARWSGNAIDAFVKQALDQKGLAPAGQADRNTLIRRAYLDLTGLLPSPQDVDAFVKDPSPRAYENLIDKLLASPQYGERWGRFWLDVVRYSDSSGFEHDRDLANAWRYRDYVIKALNQDKPYDRFLIEQLAGDETEERDYDSLIATSFYRIGPRVRFREKDNPYYRYEYMDDLIRTTFQGFMGLSVNCARCHDHKFDPVTRMDYYRSMAMLFSFVDVEHPLAPADQVAAYEKTVKEIDAQVRPLRRQVAEIEAPYKRAGFEKTLAKFPEEIQIAVRTPEEKRTPGQKLLAAQVARSDVDPDAVNFVQSQRTRGGSGGRRRPPQLRVSPADHEKRQKLLDQIEELTDKMPAELPVTEGVRDGDYRLAPDGPGDEPLPGKGDRFNYGVECCFLPEPGKAFEGPPVYYAANGLDVAEDHKSFRVEPGYVRVLLNGPSPAVSHPPSNGYLTGGRRRALAEWIASPANPLTARVMVNRIWHWHFGRGIVQTPGNFGKMGLPPSHPELLDWLATEFVRQGWSIKQMHRLMMNSQTYKMASNFYQAASAEKDPNNVYLWRFPLRRLEAEAIRDVILSASGQINLEAGGEPFFPSIPESVRLGFRQGKWILTKEEPSTWRRGIYSYWKRGMKYPMFEVHDQPDVNVTCEKRTVTTVPTQALTMLNNEFVLVQAQHFAARVAREGGGDPAQQIQALYRIAMAREPTPKELDGNLAFFKKQRDNPAAGPEGSRSLAALTDLAHILLNANEFVYIQ